MPNTSTATREAWLQHAVRLFIPWFAELGHAVPEVYVSVSFPSTGDRGNRTGECQYTGRDGRPQLLVHPALEDPVTVLSTLIHELVHASLPVGAQHGAAFKRLATALGLTGEMTATIPTPELTSTFKRMTERTLGPYPHAGLTPGTGRPKQSTRLLKVTCPADGYTARITRKWLEQMGAPTCPCGTRMHQEP
jgi:hypothetical protein